MSFKVFVDSDVIISSLISSTGAAYFLVNSKSLNLFISNLSLQELEIVIERLDINKSKFNDLIKRKLNIIKLKEKSENLKKKYRDYVTDPNDAHIIAGACEAKAKFLISYNIKHFKTDKIKRDFGIIVTIPANLLQYLRSLN